MKKPSLADRLRYAFDHALARGPIILIGWLALATLLLIAAAVAVDLVIGAVTGQPSGQPIHVFWTFVFQALVPNPPGDIDTTPPHSLAVMLAVTVGSLLMVSILIGILTAGIHDRLERLRKGRSWVIETDHIVILGWSERVLAIIRELVIANRKRPPSCIVVLGDRDRVDMQDEIRRKVGRTGPTRVVCRSGNAIKLADLNIVSPQTARTILVVSPGGDLADAQVIKTLLAIVNTVDPRREPPCRVIAEIRQPRSMGAAGDVARLMDRNQVRLVLVGDRIAHIIAQTCRQPGLSTVYAELLDFSNESDFWFQREPALAGRTFREALPAYENAAVIGIRRGDGAVLLNPPMDARIGPEDRIIVIAGDAAAVRPAALTAPVIDENAIRCSRPAAPTREQILILGWNWRAPIILAELDAHAVPGSRVTVVADDPDAEGELGGRAADLRHLTCEFRAGDTSDHATLESLHVATYDRVIVLCYSDTLDVPMADARTLFTLLHLHNIAGRTARGFSVTSEMLDTGDMLGTDELSDIGKRNLADVTGADDVIFIDRLASLLLAQLSENPDLDDLLTELFDPGGPKICLKAATDYVEPGVRTFHTVVEAAQRRGETAFGYWLAPRQAAAAVARGEANNAASINPAKSQPITFLEGDRILVLAKSGAGETAVDER